MPSFVWLSADTCLLRQLTYLLLHMRLPSLISHVAPENVLLLFNIVFALLKIHILLAVFQELLQELELIGTH